MRQHININFHTKKLIRLHKNNLLTFPTATAEVAISRTKLSPLFAGAATARGLVPRHL